VSSINQSNDLERQRQLMIQKYPNYDIIEDIGSGLNLNKRGIKRIIKMGIEGKINELVIAYKDRLTRFGYELIENIINEYSNGRIIILNKQKDLKPEEELVLDVMALMNVYVAKMNGLRRYKIKNTIKKRCKISRNIKI
jgi:putative resolvase